MNSWKKMFYIINTNRQLSSLVSFINLIIIFISEEEDGEGEEEEDEEDA